MSDSVNDAQGDEMGVEDIKFDDNVDSMDAKTQPTEQTAQPEVDEELMRR